VSQHKSAYLIHIHDQIRRIRIHTQGGREDFFDNPTTQDAVLRNIEIIGQAVKDFGIEELSSRNPSIPWLDIAGMRDELAHAYMGVDFNVVWEVVAVHLEPLNAAIEEIAAELGIQIPMFH
jgi:uncharacterized protein with HEPN domain